MYPCFRSNCCSGEALHPAVSAARSCMRDVKWSLWDANDFCVVGGWGALQFCTFDLHTPGMSTVADAASYRRPHPINDQQMSRSIPQPLPLKFLRKTAKTVPLKVSKYLYKNTFYNYAEQLIRFSLNCCTRKWSCCNSPQPIVENVWYWTWGYFAPPIHKRLKFFGCTTGPLATSFSLSQWV